MGILLEVDFAVHLSWYCASSDVRIWYHEEQCGICVRSLIVSLALKSPAIKSVLRKTMEALLRKEGKLFHLGKAQLHLPTQWRCTHAGGKLHLKCFWENVQSVPPQIDIFSYPEFLGKGSVFLNSSIVQNKTKRTSILF